MVRVHLSAFLIFACHLVDLALPCHSPSLISTPPPVRPSARSTTAPKRGPCMPALYELRKVCRPGAPAYVGLDSVSAAPLPIARRRWTETKQQTCLIENGSVSLDGGVRPRCNACGVAVGGTSLSMTALAVWPRLPLPGLSLTTHPHLPQACTTLHR